MQGGGGGGVRVKILIMLEQIKKSMSYCQNSRLSVNVSMLYVNENSALKVATFTVSSFKRTVLRIDKGSHGVICTLSLMS